MSLDIILEADEQLSTGVIEASLRDCGCLSISEDEGELEASFPSGMAVRCTKESVKRPPSSEETRGLSFPVAIRCMFRIRSPEPPEHSSLEEIDRILRTLEKNSAAQFVVSFQYESLMYWRAENGLQKV